MPNYKQLITLNKELKGNSFLSIFTGPSYYSDGSIQYFLSSSLSNNIYIMKIDNEGNIIRSNNNFAITKEFFE